MSAIERWLGLDALALADKYAPALRRRFWPTPAEQYELYKAAREAYEQDQGIKEAMLRWLTPDVAALIEAEEQQAREEARRSRLARRALVASYVVIAAMLCVYIALGVMMAWTIASTPMGVPLTQPRYTPPPVVTRYLGPGELITEANGDRHVTDVSAVVEKTNGPETELPILYIDKSGNPHRWDGWFAYIPAGQEIP